MKLTQRDWIFIVLLIAMPLGAWLMIFRPQGQEIAKSRSRIAVRQAELEKMSLATEEMARINDEIIRCQEALSYFRARLPKEKEMDQVLRDIWRLMEDSELEAVSIRAVGGRKAKDIGSSEGFASQQVALQLQGRFAPAFYNFLTQLENSHRITRVGDMDIKTRPGDLPGMAEISMVMNVYYEK